MDSESKFARPHASKDESVSDPPAREDTRLDLSTPPEYIPSVSFPPAGAETEAEGKAILEPGRLGRVGPYVLLEEIARGGMGIVYKARHSKLGRLAALKTMQCDSVTHPEQAQRFDREMRAAARLSHAHIVPIYEIGQYQGRPYYAMGFLPGGSLDRHMPRFLASPEKAVTLLLQVARAVAHAHVEGVVHRDLKPGNILLDAEDQPHVSDFGLARIVDSDELLTQAGTVIGTPAYMAPEQALGRTTDIGPGTDVWALGVMLYELLTGQRPFTGENGESVKMKILTETPVPPRTVQPNLSPALERIILKCLQKNSHERYPTAAALAEDLDQFLQGRGTTEESVHRPSRRLFLAVTGTLAAGAAVTGGVLYFASRDSDPPKKGQGSSAEQARELIGNTGEPSQIRLVLADRKAQAISTATDTPFSCHSEGFALFELLPAIPTTHFQLEAEIRLGEGGENKAGGIYFGYTTYLSGLEQQHSFWSFTYRELPNPAEAILRQVEAVRIPVRPPQHRYTFPISLQRPRLPAARGGEPGKWRRIAVVLDGREFRALWGKEKEILAREPLQEVQQRTRSLFAQTDIKNAEFTPQGGIGIYLADVRASFRNVVFTPLA
jgi:serine/threonine protein kinase